MDESIRASVATQRPVALLPPTDPSGKVFSRLADKLVELFSLGNIEPRRFSDYWLSETDIKTKTGALPGGENHLSSLLSSVHQLQQRDLGKTPWTEQEQIALSESIQSLNRLLGIAEDNAGETENKLNQGQEGNNPPSDGKFIHDDNVQGTPALEKTDKEPLVDNTADQSDLMNYLDPETKNSNSITISVPADYEATVHAQEVQLQAAQTQVNNRELLKTDDRHQYLDTTYGCPDELAKSIKNLGSTSLNDFLDSLSQAEIEPS